MVLIYWILSILLIVIMGAIGIVLIPLILSGAVVGLILLLLFLVIREVCKSDSKDDDDYLI